MYVKYRFHKKRAKRSMTIT